MTRLILAVALLAGVTMLTTVSAQQKTKDPLKKEVKKEPSAGAGKVEIFMGKAGYRWRIVDGEGKTIAMPVPSKHWDKKEDAIKALDELKDLLNKSKPVELKD